MNDWATKWQHLINLLFITFKSDSSNALYLEQYHYLSHANLVLIFSPRTSMYIYIIFLNIFFNFLKEHLNMTCEAITMSTNQK
jgi:hypothetical protein